MGNQSLRRALLVSPVALHHRGASHEELAHLTCARLGTGIGYDEDLHIVDGAADRDRLGLVVGDRRDVVPGAHVGLGGPEQVAEPSRGELLHQRSEVPRREDLAREEHHAQGWQRPWPQTTACGDHREDRRNRVPDRDALALDQLRQLAREQRDPAWNEDNGGSGQGRGEEVEGGEVEVERGVTGQTIIGRQTQLPSGPGHEGQSVLVAELDPLRGARGSRRVEDVGHVEADPVGRQRLGRALVDGVSAHRLGATPVPGGVRHRTVCAQQHLDARPGGEQVGPPRGHGCRGHEHPQPAVGRDPAEARRRGRRVEWDVDTARLQDPVHGRDGLDRLLEVEPNPVASMQPAVPERPCQLVGSPIELAIRDGASAVDNGDTVRAELGRPL